MPVMSKGDAMRGLAIFISDIRNCKSKEQEDKRINKELANIRSKFKGDKSLDGYNKKKYVCKLLFIFLLGYDIDFGHMEAVNLTTSNRYTEKQIGYLFISVLINSSSELFRLIIQNIKSDLMSQKTVHINLALQCIANIGTVEMADAFVSEVPKLLVAKQASETVKQSAALCVLRLFRASPTSIDHIEWAPKLIHLLNDPHLGVVTCCTTLIEALAQQNPENYQGCVSIAVSRLSKIVTAMHADLLDYTYYLVPAPWLCVKLLRLLQCYPLSDDVAIKGCLIECLEAVLNKCQEPAKSKKIQHSNAKNAVLFEAIYLIIHIECEQNLLVRACDLLGHFLQHRETNLRYLALESLCRLAGSEFSLDIVKKHRGTVIKALKLERDISVRQRAVDLLYAICDTGNAREIVSEMLGYLERADYSIREEMVLKIAILAEKYASDCKWYVDMMLHLISVAGDYVSEEVWNRVIQIIVNGNDVQTYAAKTVFETASEDQLWFTLFMAYVEKQASKNHQYWNEKMKASSCHENMMKVGGFVLGEFGHLIATDETSTPLAQFHLIHAKYHLCSPSTKAMLLSTYIKFINFFPDLKSEIQEVLRNENQLRNANVELQQRVVEYLHLIENVSSELLATVFEEMPPFPERESSILAKLKKKRPSIIDVLEKNHGKLASNLDLTSRKSSLAATTTRHSAALSSEAPVEVNNDLLDLGQQDFDPLNLKFSGVMSERQMQDTVFNAIAIANEAEFLARFLFKNSGILYEDDFLQIGVKSEFKDHSGQISFFFGNKTSEQLMNFNADCQQTQATEGKLAMRVQKPAPGFINGGDQVQFIVNVECLQVFKESPLLRVSFNHMGSLLTNLFKVPVLVNKFFQSVEMSSGDFFTRWTQLGQNSQECQKIFEAKYDLDVEQLKNKITGFGLACLPGIDPKPENLVGTGIIKTATTQIGCLLRLEPSQELQEMQEHALHCW